MKNVPSLYQHKPVLTCTWENCKESKSILKEERTRKLFHHSKIWHLKIFCFVFWGEILPYLLSLWILILYSFQYPVFPFVTCIQLHLVFWEETLALNHETCEKPYWKKKKLQAKPKEISILSCRCFKVLYNSP